MTISASRIGRYTVDQVVGAGAFATVYRATDERLDATVAVKVLAENHCLDPEIRARFVEEGRALRRIDSPHVIRVYDMGETEQMQPYLVMEHADRGTLAQRISGLRAGGWRPTVEDLRQLVADLATAIEAVHAAQLVHRDLSPGNVLLRAVATTADTATRPATPLVAADERLVVADLGLAKDLARSSGLTVAGGTEGFRPPEQRASPARVDGRSDLWALSAVLFWVLTEQAPGTADNASDTRQLDRTLAAALTDLGLPPTLRAPVMTSLADDPARRHADVAAWRGAVEAALAQAPAPPPATTPDPASRSARRRRLAGGVALLLVGAAVGAGATRLSDGSDGASQVTTTELDDGRVEVADVAGDSRLALRGPRRAEVGDTVTLEARVEGMDDWAWWMPDGTLYPDETEVQLRISSAGTAEVTLLGTADSGERLEVTHTFTGE
jgi:eukaryotic-like serine/threonine-protein kinase